MDCPYCGFKDNPPESVYCIACGHKISEYTPPAVMCPQLQLPDDSSIPIGTSPQIVGRTELLNYLRTLSNVDPAIISRQHFTILQENEKYYIIDGKTTVQERPSANHTYLNGVDITGKGQKDLNNGDVIDVANTVKLTFTT